MFHHGFKIRFLYFVKFNFHTLIHILLTHDLFEDAQNIHVWLVNREKYQHFINSGFLFWPPAFTRRSFLFTSDPKQEKHLTRPNISHSVRLLYFLPCRVIFGCQDARLQEPSGGGTFDGEGNFKCRRRNHHLLTVVSQSAHFSSCKSGHFTFCKSGHFQF